MPTQGKIFFWWLEGHFISLQATCKKETKQSKEQKTKKRRKNSQIWANKTARKHCLKVNIHENEMVIPSVLQIYDMPFCYSVKFKNNIQIYLVYKSV